MTAPLTSPGTSRRLARVRVALVVAVAVLAATVTILAYLVSFEAISAFVVRIGALPPQLRWCGPFLVDSFITIATLFLLWLALSGVPLRRVWDAWYAWLLIALATAASAYLNAAHVQTHRWDARITAGAVPFALLASVHLLVLLLLRLLAWAPAADPPAVADPQSTAQSQERAAASVRQAAARPAAVARPTTAAGALATAAAVSPVPVEIPATAAPDREGEQQQQTSRQRVAVLVAEEAAGIRPRLTGEQVAALLGNGVKERWATELLRQERETLARRNGLGPLSQQRNEQDGDER
jgi:hypothetical protein